MGPDLSSGVGSSAGESHVYLPYVYVCCLNRQTEPLGFDSKLPFAWLVPPRIFIQHTTVGCRGEGS